MSKIKSKYLEEYFKPLVINSKSIREVSDKLNINCKGGTYKTIKKYINLYQIDTSHFYTKQEMYNMFLKNKKYKELEEILIENSTYRHTTNLKNRLYQANLKKRFCEICNQSEIWMGNKISLILDHINGNPTDNRIDNLRILCPNCNASTATFSRGHKKMKNNNYCKCGIKITKKSLTCHKCRDRTQTRKVKNRPNYSTLISQIKEFGYVGTSRIYGVSDNAIRKWIKNEEKHIYT